MNRFTCSTFSNCWSLLLFLYLVFSDGVFFLLLFLYYFIFNLKSCICLGSDIEVKWDIFLILQYFQYIINKIKKNELKHFLVKTYKFIMINSLTDPNILNILKYYILDRHHWIIVYINSLIVHNFHFLKILNTNMELFELVNLTEMKFRSVGKIIIKALPFSAIQI